MASVDQDSELAQRLARVLPDFVRASAQVAGDGGRDDPEREPLRAMLSGHPGDQARAVAVELASLLAAHPELVDLAARSRTRDRRSLAHELREVLTASDEHAANMLRTLLMDPEPGAERPPSSPARLARLFPSDVLARSTAAISMTVLIAVPVAWATTMHVLGQAPAPETDVNAVALRMFAIWSLSFLPGWLYVRFLGQRAGALWNEYVLQLHRLGWDAPEFLPEPTASSEFHAEWRQGGGRRTPTEDNIYRQKFNAYYGRMVSEATPDEDFQVRSQTMFPVFLLTMVLATGWVAVLWDTGFITQVPGANDTVGLVDLLKFAFLGAYAFIVQSLIRRFFQSDLRPSAYAGAVLRIVLALIVVIPVYYLLGPEPNGGGAVAVAFVVGAMPAVGIQALQRAAAAALRVLMPQMTPDYPLNQLDGLNIWYEARLVEEGIEDMQNLATANLVDVVLHTRVPVGRLVDWIDQAHLYLHLDRAERGRFERWRSGRRAQRRSDDGDVAARVPERDGSGARTSLRRLGIRTATDLLKAYPPAEVATWCAEPDVGLPSGLSWRELQLLVRVLDGQPGLTPVWNWQRHGPGPS
jgi:hypothetical protein